MAPSDELATRIAGLAPDRRLALVRRLYRERGWRVTETDAPDGWSGLRVVSSNGRRRRLVVATAAGAERPETKPGDWIVRPGEVEDGSATNADTTPRRVVDATTLAEQIRYALRPDAQRRLAETVFDTDRATMLDPPERNRESPDATPTVVTESDATHTPVVDTEAASTATEEPDATTETRGKSPADSTANGSVESPRRRLVAAGAVLVGVIVVALAGGGTLSALDGGVLSGSDGSDTTATSPFEGRTSTPRGVSGVTPTPGNVAPGPDSRSRDGQTTETTEEQERDATATNQTTPTPADRETPVESPHATGDTHERRSHRSVRSISPYVHHSTRYVQRSAPSARQPSPTSVASA